MSVVVGAIGMVIKSLAECPQDQEIRGIITDHTDYMKMKVISFVICSDGMVTKSFEEILVVQEIR